MTTNEQNLDLATRNEREQEAAALQQVGGAAMTHSIDTPEDSDGGMSLLVGEEFQRTADEFAVDPVGSLAPMRETLFAISRNERLPKESRQEKLSDYLDAYFDVTVRLDQSAFPEDKPGIHHERISAYIPDGFVDMGRDPRHDPAVRDREQIWVDKREILARYKPLLAQVFERDYSTLTPEAQSLNMAYRIAREVYQSIPRPEYVEDGDLKLGGDKVKLSEINEAICRHRALLFQVLSQAVGLNTREIKGTRISGSGVENHAANLLEAGDAWFLVDVSNPYYTHNADGQEVFLPAVYGIDGGPLARAESRRLSLTRTTWGEVPRVRYIARDDMYWHIEHHPRYGET